MATGSEAAGRHDPAKTLSRALRLAQGAWLSVRHWVRAQRADQAKLRETELRFRNLVEGSLQGFAIVRHDRAVFCNRACAQILGFRDPEEVTALPSMRALLPPHERERLNAYVQERLAGRAAPVHFEFQVHRRDGRLIWLDTVTTLVTWQGEPAFQSAIFDITERKETEAELRESKNLLQTAIDSIPHDIFVKDRRGRMVTVNRRFQATFQRKAEEMLGRQFAHPGPETEQQEIVESDRRVLEQGEAMDYVQARTLPSGKIRQFRVIKTPLRDAEGHVTGLVGIAEDITERKRAEQQLRESQALLQAMVNTIPHMLYVKDADGRYLMVNRSYCRILDIEPEDIVGKAMPELEFYSPEMRRIYWEQDQKVLASGEPVRNAETHFTLANGETRYYLTHKNGLRDEKGRIIGLVGITEDITAQKAAQLQLEQSEKRLRESERLLKTVFDTVPLRLFVKDSQGRYVIVNQAMADHHGVAPQDFVGRDATSFVHFTPESMELVRASDRRVFSTGQRAEIPETPFLAADGTPGVDRVIKMPVRDDTGAVRLLVGIAEDITGRKRAEDELRASQHLLQTVFDALPYGAFIKDTESRYLSVNRSFCETWGIKPSEIVGKRVVSEELRPPEDTEIALESDRIVLESGKPFDFTPVQNVPGAGRRLIRVRKTPLRNEGGAIVGLVGAIEDMTERNRAEEELRANQRLLRTLIDALPLGVTVKDTQGRFQLANKAVQRVFGIPMAKALGRTARDVPSRNAAITDVMEAADRQVIREGEMVEIPDLLTSREGEPARWDRVIKLPLRNEADAIVGVVSVSEDITARKRAEDELRANQRLLRTLIDALPLGVSVKDTQGRFQLVNKAVETLIGLPAADLLGGTVRDMPGRISAIADEMEAADRQVISRGEMVELSEVRTSPDGTPEHWERLFKVPLRDEAGAIVGLVTVAEDITARRHAEEERLNLERRVLQAQKLESLGVLAGGVAHDFNNLLTSVLGNAELVLADLPAGHPARASMEDIKAASQRAAALTGQMLDYAGKGRAAAQTLNLNEVLKEIGHLLRVPISKKVDIQYRLAEQPPGMTGDAAQVQQVAMNLITNAAEAIGDAPGTITITTGTVAMTRDMLAQCDLEEAPPPGDFVFLEVTDTGGGMTAEVKARMFEPFFTTKFTGRGLGLAALLGIVRRHGGTIQIHTGVGQGTRFRVLFPATALQGGSASKQPPQGPVWQGSGQILIVDDESMVRSVLQRQLHALGFHALLAENGQQALDLIARHDQRISAVLLDMTMPVLNGLETLQRMRELGCEAPVILCSGYDTAETLAGNLGPCPTAVLQKPVRLETLRDTLRKILQA